jgi:spore coat polysaccharide biosynthesis predicted glycosyltransferase SpsG
MKECDIAVTSSGTMVYELAAIGLPSILITQASNQFLVSDYIARNDLGINAGSWDTVDINSLKNIVRTLLWDYNKRKCLSDSMIKSVDKKGARNAVAEILRLKNKGVTEN